MLVTRRGFNHDCAARPADSVVCRLMTAIIGQGNFKRSGFGEHGDSDQTFGVAMRSGPLGCSEKEDLRTTQASYHAEYET